MDKASFFVWNAGRPTHCAVETFTFQILPPLYFVPPILTARSTPPAPGFNGFDRIDEHGHDRAGYEPTKPQFIDNCELQIAYFVALGRIFSMHPELNRSSSPMQFDTRIRSKTSSFSEAMQPGATKGRRTLVRSRILRLYRKADTYTSGQLHLHACPGIFGDAKRRVAVWARQLLAVDSALVARSFQSRTGTCERTAGLTCRFPRHSCWRAV